MQRRVMKGFITVVLIGILTAGCATMEENPKTSIGAIGGGALGGLIAAAAGGNAATIAASAVGGILLGGLVGNLLDERDKRLAAEAAQRALETGPTGNPVSWKNPDSGHYGTVTPMKTYQTASGSYCREYQTTVIVDGKQEAGYGTACRQPDGSWKIVN
jgi:surface antigen